MVNKNDGTLTRTVDAERERLENLSSKMFDVCSSSCIIIDSVIYELEEALTIAKNQNEHQP